MKKIDKKVEPLVSIVIPVYNSSNYLKDCINSITNQTYKNIEILIVDDGSTDDSLSICKELAKRDQRVKVFSKPNGGAGSARNKGISLAKGEYVQFVDSDDKIKSNMTELLVSQIGNSDTVICGYEYHRNNKKIGEQKTKAITDNIKNNREMFITILNKYTFTPINKLYRKETLPQFDEKEKFGEDFLFNINYYKNIETLTIISETPYIYNVDTPGSLTKSYKKEYYNLFKKIYHALVDFNSEKLKNCYGEDFIYEYLFEHLLSIVLNAIVFDKQNSSFVYSFLQDPFVNNVVKKVKYKGKKLSNKVKIFLIKRKCAKIYTLYIKLRRRYYLRKFIN